jgi:hypothetical protein
MHTVSLHRSKESGMEENGFDQSQYQANATGDGVNIDVKSDDVVR